MARKNKNTIETEEMNTDTDVVVPSVSEAPLPQAEPVKQSTVAQQAAIPVQKTPVPPKKRVRIRPSQKKKLSVAVLCTNPLTRRFI